MLSKTSQTKGDEHHGFSHTCNLENGSGLESKCGLLGTKGSREGVREDREGVI